MSYKPCPRLPTACHLSRRQFYRELRLKMFIKCSIWHSSPPQPTAERTGLSKLLSYSHVLQPYSRSHNSPQGFFSDNWSKYSVEVGTEKATFISLHRAESRKQTGKSQYIWHHSKYPNLVTSCTAFGFWFDYAHEGLTLAFQIIRKHFKVF